MDRDRLAYLEKKYWKGKTSLQEEIELQNAVRSGSDAVSDLLTSIFNATAQSREISLDDDFDSAFWQKANVEHNDNRGLVFTLSAFMRYAAVGIILLGIGGVVWNLAFKTDNKVEVAQTEFTIVDTYDDPEKAFEETKKALMYASQKLNQGKEPLGEIKRFYNAKMSIAGTPVDTVNYAKTNNSSK